MVWMFKNNSCNPFFPDIALYILGNYVSYAVNASTAEDIKEAVIFANLFNIHLIIRTIDHNYNRKSTGAGALAIWIYHLITISLIESYKSSVYTGKVVVLGAGVSSQQTYEFVDANDSIIIKGNCPTIVLADGYGQGGGHGPFATKFDLAIDQFLE